MSEAQGREAGGRRGAGREDPGPGDPPDGSPRGFRRWGVLRGLSPRRLLADRRPSATGVEGLSPALSLLVLVGPLIFLVLFFFYPMGSVMARGLTGESGRLSLARVIRILADPYYRHIIRFTVIQAVLSTALAVLMGLPGAYLLARYEFVGKRFVRALTTVPFVLPSIIVVLGFVRFFGNNGLLNRALMAAFHLQEPPLRILYSFKAILLAHAFYNFPVCIRIVAAVWGRLRSTTEDAARSLGAHGLRLFWRVTLPQILPGILSAAALIFIFCLLSFAVVLVLGGGPRFSTIEVEVYRLAKVSVDLETASALAFVGSLVSLGFLYLYIRLQSRSSFGEELGGTGDTQRLSTLLRRPVGSLFVLYLGLMTVVVLAPMATVVVYSFQVRTGWSLHEVSLDWYRRLFAAGGPYLRAIRNSLFFGALTVAFSLPLGTVLAYVAARSRMRGRQVVEALMMLPMGVSSIILGLGYLSAFRHLPGFGDRLTGTWYSIVLAHTVIAYPFVIRATGAMFRKIRPSLAEAARSLGAGPWKVFWRLELPLARSALVTGAAFAFGISVGEINATLMLYNSRLTTMPVMIYRLIASYNFIGATAMGSLLMLLSFLAFLVIDRAGEEA